MKKNKVLVYGAAGYTGRIICNRLVELGINFCIAGRDEYQIRLLALELNVSYYIFETKEFDKWKIALGEVDCLINAAGPFQETARNAIDACIAYKVHYLDISAELRTYELAETYDQLAKSADIMLISGAGLFVSYDALVVHTSKRISNPESLDVAFRHVGGFSKGSLKSSKNILDLGLLVREKGKLIQSIDGKSKFFDFGDGPEECFPTPLGGVVLSYRSTKIPNIREYFQLQLSEASDSENSEKNGPSQSERSSGRSKLSVEITNNLGERVISIADLPSGYDLTPWSVVAVAQRVLRNDFKTGYQSPGSAYGEEIFYEIPTAKITDK